MTSVMDLTPISPGLSSETHHFKAAFSHLTHKKHEKESYSRTNGFLIKTIDSPDTAIREDGWHLTKDKVGNDAFLYIHVVDTTIVSDLVVSPGATYNNVKVGNRIMRLFDNSISCMMSFRETTFKAAISLQIDLKEYKKGNLKYGFRHTSVKIGDFGVFGSNPKDALHTELRRISEILERGPLGYGNASNDIDHAAQLSYTFTMCVLHKLIEKRGWAIPGKLKHHISNNFDMISKHHVMLGSSPLRKLVSHNNLVLLTNQNVEVDRFAMQEYYNNRYAYYSRYKLKDVPH